MFPSLLRSGIARRAQAALPLGVDLRKNDASIVCGVRDGDSVRVTRTLTVPLSAPDAIVSALEAEGIETRNAVIALEARDVRTGPLPHGAALPPQYHTSSAEHYAEELIPIVPDGDARRARLIVEGEHATIVAVLESRYRATVERALEYGLNVVAVDAPGLAWLRVAPDGIAVIGESTMLVARTSTGLVVQPAEKVDVATYFAQAISRARAERQLAVDCLHTTAPPGHALYDHAKDMRYRPLTIADRVTPDWAFAYALFTWSLA